jgi:hypothetical protein
VEEEEGMNKGHISVDVHTKDLVGIEITDKRVGDSTEFKNLV